MAPSRSEPVTVENVLGVLRTLSVSPSVQTSALPGRLTGCVGVPLPEDRYPRLPIAYLPIVTAEPPFPPVTPALREVNPRPALADRTLPFSTQTWPVAGVASQLARLSSSTSTPVTAFTVAMSNTKAEEASAPAREGFRRGRSGRALPGTY